jgi:hypothetical protein
MTDITRYKLAAAFAPLRTFDMILKPETIDNKAMAQIEAPFKEWCDAMVDGGLLNE